MAVETFTKSGAKSSIPAKLDKNIFGLKIRNQQLLKDVYLAYMANRRSNLAKTKKRGEVRGGGQKPWRQKGTGRARFGSSRNPIWTGGGVAFGPTGSENFSRRIGIKSKRLALKQALSVCADENRIKVVDSFDFSGGKVKSVLNLLRKIKVGGNVLLVTDNKDEQFEHATRNLPNVITCQVSYLSVFQVLNADVMVISKKALELLTERLGE